LIFQVSDVASGLHHHTVRQRQDGVLFQFSSSSMVLALVNLLDAISFLVLFYPSSKRLQQYHKQNQAMVGISQFSVRSVFCTTAMH
jgi:hypothetical protein